jgi:DegV family protein with EDD domain
MPNAETLPVHVVTGVTSDIPAAWAKEHNVGIVPALIMFGNKEIMDTPDFTMEAFLDKLKNSGVFPTTSAPNPEIFKPFYTYQGPIISVHAGDKVSSFWANSLLAKVELNRENIYPYNTQSVSLGEGFLAMRAAELTEQGATKKEIFEVLDDMRPRTHVVALCDTLKYLKAGGRVTGGKALLGAILNVKPSVHMYENALVPIARERTHKRAIAELVEWVSNFKPFERLAVLHDGNLEYAQELAYALRDEFEQEKILITLVTKAVAAHAGPDAVGAAFVTKRKI